MKKVKIIGFSLFIIPILISIGFKNHDNSFKNLEIKIDSLRVKYNIPAIAYGIIRNDSVLVEHVTGFRNIETKEKASPNDLFHIGSNTKAFTSFLAGKLIEKGLISWNTKFFDL